MSCGCPPAPCAPNPCCTPSQQCQPENWGLTFPSLVGPQGPPGGPGTYVENYAEARLIDYSSFVAGYVVNVGGYADINDGAGGPFEYDPTSVAADNDGTILRPANGIGRLLRIYSGDINPVWFGWFGDGATFGDTAAAAIVALAKLTGATINHPEGTFLLRSHYPVRQAATPPVALDDFNGITVMGKGRSTIIKTQNLTDGADVFQLNGVKNVTVFNLTVASVLPGGATSGSNGFSVTNGGENILVTRCFADRMPYVISGVDFDGGSAFSIQHSLNALNDKNIRFINNSALGTAGTAGSYGFNMILSGASRLTNPPQGIVFTGNTLSTMYRGVYLECTGTGAPPAAINGMSALISDNPMIDIQQAFTMYAVTGINCSVNTYTSSFGAGNPGFNAATPLKWGVVILSCHSVNFVGNIVRMANSDYFGLIGGGATGEAATPTDRLNFANNHFFGATSSAYGLMSTTTASYDFTNNSNFVGNTFEGAAGADYDPIFKSDGRSNTIISVGGSYFPSVVQSTFNAGNEQIEGWTQGSSPFGTLVVSANGHDITSLVAAGANLFAGWQIDLVPGRIYEVVATASAANLFLFTNSVLGTAQDGALNFIPTTSERSSIFKAVANDNFIILKSTGAFTGSLTVSLREVPINCQANLWVERNIRAALPIFANNAAAIAAGLQVGEFYRINAATDPEPVFIVH